MQNARTQILIFFLKIDTLVIPLLDYDQLGSAELSPDSAVNDHSVVISLMRCASSDVPGLKQPTEQWQFQGPAHILPGNF